MDIRPLDASPPDIRPSDAGPCGTCPPARTAWPLAAALLALAWLPRAVAGAALLTAALLWGAGWMIAVPLVLLVPGLLRAVSGRERLPGRAVQPADEPELFALVRDVADRVGFREPLLVRVVPVVQASLGRARVAGRRGHVLLLGFPLLRTLTEAQLASVVAHELAHQRLERDRSTAALRFARAMLADRVGHRRFRPLRPLAGPLLRASQPAMWRAELTADREAARVAGSEATGQALRRTAVLDAAFEGLGVVWWTALAEEDAYPEDFYAALGTALTDPYVIARAARTAAADDAVDPYAAADHPPAEQRVAALREAVEPAGAYGGGPVTLRTGAAIEEWCVRELADAEGRDGESTPVRLLDLPDDRLHALGGTLGQDLLLHVTGAKSPRLALAGVLDAVAEGSGQRLARHLEPGLKRLPAAARPAVAEQVLAGAATPALAAVLRASGWQAAGRWLTTVLTAPDGRVVDLHELVTAAVRSGDAGPVRALLAHADGPTAGSGPAAPCPS
jgi:Zn-dependent protease with chaperone function